MKQITSILSAFFVLLSCGSDDATKSEQTITFAPLAPRNLSEGSFTLTATSSSGLTVAYTGSDPSVATIAGATVTLHKAGVTTITASQSGNDAWFEAPRISRQLVVNEDNNPNKQSQTIAFELGIEEFFASQGTLTLEATATSGLPVTFTSSSDEALIQGNRLTLIYTGEHYQNLAIQITATQSGDATYNAAQPVTRSLRITHDLE
jgi:hypothetical protein